MTPGVGWIANEYLLVYPGWLAYRPMVNTSAPLYAVMKAGFDKYWLQGYRAGNVIANASTPSQFSVSAFNAFHAAASTLHTMFLKMHPPVYTGNKVCVCTHECVARACHDAKARAWRLSS